MGELHKRHSHAQTSKRCCVEGCGKLAKDFIGSDKIPLCRIHSPSREGWETAQKKLAKEKKK